MNKQRRNTKNALRALSVIGGFLLLALIGAVVYFYAIEGTDEEIEERTEITCGCYLIDPAVVNDCGDPKKAILFTLKTVTSDETCRATCDTGRLLEYSLNSETPISNFKSCNVNNVRDIRCSSMILKDQHGRLITGRINEDDEIHIEAGFDRSTYSNYAFRINTETTEPDRIEDNKIFKSLTGLRGNHSVEIVATATDSKGEQINSMVCRRVVDIRAESSSSVNALSAITERQSDGKTKLSQITVSVGQLTSEDVSIRFNFGNQYEALTAIKGIDVEIAKGSIKMIKADLYDAQNFESGKSFSILDNHIGDLQILAEVFVQGTSLGSASTTVTFAEPSDPIDPDPPITDPGDSKSNFSVSKSGTPSCVERVGNNNTAIFTITVRNRRTEQDSLTSVKDKLPLGFSYVAGSTTINGQAVADSSVVRLNNIGDTQEITWQQSTPWSIGAGSQLEIIFRATADENTITGQNLNEVIINPVLIPEDPTTLRTETAIVVAQDCSDPAVPPPPTSGQTPSTGIFDNVIVRIVLGIILFSTGWLVYIRPEGTKLSKMVIDSNIYKDAELTKYKFTNPKKYFEEKIIRGDTKEKK
jgi:uncharacterized repeat protein (TIGR01451 family)